MLSPIALAQHVSTHADDAANENANEATRRGRMLGMLVYRSVTLELDGASAREALNAIRTQARLPMIVRWTAEHSGRGIDPEASVSVSLAGVSALEALEKVLEQIAAAPAHAECTWQLRRGFIEVGTKSRLAVPAAREMRLYDIRDMMIEAPTFSSDDSGLVRAFRRQNNTQNTDPRARKDDRDSIRKTPQLIAVGVITEICETIEPGRWDFGQPIDREIDDDRLVPLPEGPGQAPATPGDSGGAAGPDLKSAAQPAATPHEANGSTSAPIAAVDSEVWAAIRLWRDQLIVTAPDFIHRQVGGYPKAIPPDDADPSLLNREDEDVEP